MYGYAVWTIPCGRPISELLTCILKNQAFSMLIRIINMSQFLQIKPNFQPHCIYKTTSVAVD